MAFVPCKEFEVENGIEINELVEAVVAFLAYDLVFPDKTAVSMPCCVLLKAVTTWM